MVSHSSFPQGFLLGAATAAHQVEGNNTNSDDWALEHIPHSEFAEPSGMADDEWNRYKEDIDLLAGAGLNAYRFSIEWARIEPQEGHFDPSALDHYRREIDYCHSKGVEPVVTLLHFTSPLWLIREGGWTSEKTPARFARYVQYVMENLGGRLHWVCTINEANMGLQVAELIRRYRQQAQAAASRGKVGDASVQMGINLKKMAEKQKLAAQEKQRIFGTPTPATFTSGLGMAGDRVILEAHRQAMAVIRKVAPNVKAGLTLSLHAIQPVTGGEQEARRLWDEEFRHYLPTIRKDDFLGIQNYTRTLVGPHGQLPVPSGAEKTKSGYEFCPQALEHAIRAVAKDFHGTLLVTENGCDTDDDTKRVEFIRQALAGVRSCLDDGLPVRGYFYWSLLDNFEWQKGFYDTFGLVAVDRPSQVRHPKPSLDILGSYAPKKGSRE